MPKSINHRRSRPTQSGHKRRPLLETLESRQLLAVDWRNPADQFDVNADQAVTALDALQVINELNRRESGDSLLSEPYAEGRPYVDVNGNGSVSAVDALQIINELNRGISGERSQVDGDRLISEQSTLVTLGETAGKRTYRLEIDGLLGSGTSGFDLTNDVLAIYLVDPDDPTRSLIGEDGGNRRPLFSMTATDVRSVPGISRWDGNSLEIDFTGVEGTNTGRMVLQTINRNGGADSSLSFRLLENRVFQANLEEERELSLAVTPLAPVGEPIDVSGFVSTESIAVEERFTSFDTVNRTLTSELALRNFGQAIGRSAIVAFPWTTRGRSSAKRVWGRC